MPTRLLVGEVDPVASRTMLTGWESHAADLRVDIAPRAGHFVPEQIPTRVVALAHETFS